VQGRRGTKSDSYVQGRCNASFGSLALSVKMRWGGEVVALPGWCRGGATRRWRGWCSGAREGVAVARLARLLVQGRAEGRDVAGASRAGEGTTRL
jgi:hypothetical protein